MPERPVNQTNTATYATNAVQRGSVNTACTITTTSRRSMIGYATDTIRRAAIISYMGWNRKPEVRADLGVGEARVVLVGQDRLADCLREQLASSSGPS